MARTRRITLLAALVATILGAFTPALSATKPLVVGGARPVTVNLPSDISKLSPLLIMLHSASTSGAHQERYMKLAPVAKRMGMIYIAPDGTVGADGRRVWNASKACCQRSGTPVDDIAYITSLIDEIAAKVPVDRSRIYMIGHSNGAFMSLAYACTTGSIAAVVSLAGALDKDYKCSSAKPFALLQIHGAADKTIKIGGGVLNGYRYTSALETIQAIAESNGCRPGSPPRAPWAKKDFDPSIPGAETTVEYLTGCNPQLEFWRIARGSHSPRLPADYADQVLRWILSA
ncbi:LpqC Poly(3-hydroxybutyrate) depolymerase [Candidatus Nanopelagicaceae bacterium]